MRGRKNSSVVCAVCGYPSAPEYYKRGPRKGELKKLVYKRDVPNTEEEALSRGWLQTELGLKCPNCVVNDPLDHTRETNPDPLAVIAQLMGAEKKP